MQRTATKISLAALSALAVLASSNVIAAGSLAGQLNAQMTLQAGCIVSGAPGAGATGVNFGTLDFGTQPATFTGILAATSSGGAGGAGATQILCSPDVTSLSITVSGGNNAGQGGSVGIGSRAMKLGTSSYLPYEVYSDAGMTSAYPTSASAVGVTLPGTGVALPLPIYGRINKTSPAALVSGTYTDVLQVTLAW
ncbi:Csu type fimbrial protein [Pseudorhodoferax soli]|uniref:Spore coat protein U-like protein n=1 Tax=Pseudorhodoferax soli TaxID=545864 RepID=A0A368XBG1_9BURK|nr:spore coat protein U domain-containing protein [Pseudorhodoferax soli]RCW65195.1 spore coat protein U-like protein [Pseudorhodoferax soli]